MMGEGQHIACCSSYSIFAAGMACKALAFIGNRGPKRPRARRIYMVAAPECHAATEFSFIQRSNSIKGAGRHNGSLNVGVGEHPTAPSTMA